MDATTGEPAARAYLAGKGAQKAAVTAVRQDRSFLSAERQSSRIRYFQVMYSCLIRGVEVAGGHWYASGIFLGWAGIGVGILGVASTIWVTLKAAAPRSTVWISVLDVIPVGHKRLRVPEEAWVRRAAQALAKPHMVKLRLASKGPSDIRREAFDAGRPLAVDMGAVIAGCYTSSALAVAHDGSMLLIGPSLIGRSQTAAIWLLVDGAVGRPVIQAQSLIDTDVFGADARPPLGMGVLAFRAYQLLLGIPAITTCVMLGISWVLLKTKLADIATPFALIGAVSAIIFGIVMMALLLGAVAGGIKEGWSGPQRP